MDKGIFPLSLAVGNYDRTQPLLDGRVQPKGIALKAVSGKIGDFCHRPVYEEYDAAEMSFSWYLMAHCRNDPVIALPVFPLRMPVHAYVFCRSDAPYRHPKDLRGKTIGTKQYRLTVNLWLRGIFKEYYGVSPEEVSWTTTEDEGAGFKVPGDISIKTLHGKKAEQLLLDGEIDCLFSPVIPESFKRRDPRIRRMFPDCRAEISRYFQDTGILPITHTLVMAENLWRREPWIAGSLATAFGEAQRMVEEYYHADPKRLTLPLAVLVLEEERAVFGNDPWAQGLEPNRRVIETFARYAHEQGYIPRIPSVEDLFPEHSLAQV